MKQTSRRIWYLLLTMIMLVSLCVPSAWAVEQQYSDIQGHWAEEVIDRWSDYGVVQGYGGKFHPDASITRAQMATILANALGLTETTENPFTDVAEDAWYADAVLRCYAAGIMEGSGGKADPDRQLTRQEGMVMLGRALCIPPEEEPDLSAFTDGEEVADWAAPIVAALVQSGLVEGVGNDCLAPGDSMTRAALLTVLDRAVVQYIQAPGTYELIDGEGIILVAAGDVTLTGKTTADILVTPAADGQALTFDKAEVTGAITVQADNAEITIKNSNLPEIILTGTGTTVEQAKPSGGGSSSGGSSGGDTEDPGGSGAADMIFIAGIESSSDTYRNVTIKASVGNSTVKLNHVTITGTLTIEGGGSNSNSIKLINCNVQGNVVLDKTQTGESDEPPRLALSNTPIKTVEVRQPAILQAEGSVIAAVTAKADVTVEGRNIQVTTLTVPAGLGNEDPVEVTVSTGTVSRVVAKSAATVTGGATYASVSVVEAEAPVTVTSGVVEKVEIPETATGSVSVAVSGTEAIEVEVNSSNGATITAEEGANLTISTTLDTAPPVTVNGTAVHVHKWDEGTITKEPTCTAKGIKTYTCVAKGCSAIPATKLEGIPAKGHTEVVDAAVEATCTTAGKTEGTHCSVCNAVIKAQAEVAALGHDFNGAYQYDEEGHWHKCSRCEETDTKTAHTWDEGTTAEGTTTYTCTICGATKTESANSSDGTGQTEQRSVKKEQAGERSPCLLFCLSAGD